MALPSLSGVLVVFASVMHFSSARAVNISNTWMLPEEGFPVFYRYFRDRISWYEADAVCQFHHGYLVTADSSSQYDAIRAYLKELDITDNVWIGLSKTAEKPNFTWTNFQPLSTEGHWQETIPISTNPLCVAMDPAKDFLWKPMNCGGPEVASFICELSIPEWARGCLLTELPSLTVLYIPEQSSLELTSDCGLDGTKRIACKGDADREGILNQLRCAIAHEDFEEKSTSRSSPLVPLEPPRTTKTPIWTSNTVDVDYGTPTRHRRETTEEGTASTARLTATEMFEATNYDTQVTTSNTLYVSTLMEAAETKTRDRMKTGDENSTEGNVMPPLEVTETTTAIGDNSLTAGDANFTGVENKDIAAEYPSAISQGQLFSIIENGTMFDIIELNDTSESKTQKETQTLSANQKTDSNKPSVKLTQINEKYPKKTSEAKTKPMTKKDIYKSADPKKYSPKKNYTKSELKVEEPNVNKEFEMFIPVIHDPSVKLNRTFRKELPVEPIKKEILTELSNERNSTKLSDQDLDHSNTSNIDPNLDLLNKNMAENNESEQIEQLSIKPTSEMLAETVETGAAIKPNRQRQLTRPQRRPFYPYFFSRVLG